MSYTQFDAASTPDRTVFQIFTSKDFWNQVVGWRELGLTFDPWYVSALYVGLFCVPWILLIVYIVDIPQRDIVLSASPEAFGLVWTFYVSLALYFYSVEWVMASFLLPERKSAPFIFQIFQSVVAALALTYSVILTAVENPEDDTDLKGVRALMLGGLVGMVAGCHTVTEAMQYEYHWALASLVPFFYALVYGGAAGITTELMKENQLLNEQPVPVERMSAGAIVAIVMSIVAAVLGIGAAILWWNGHFKSRIRTTPVVKGKPVQ